MKCSFPLLIGLMLSMVSQSYGVYASSENNKSADQIIIPAAEDKTPPVEDKTPPAEEKNPPISPNLPGNLPSEIPNSTTSQTVIPETNNSSALTQLMNSKAFQGLSLCTVDPWKGLEYAKNLELEYLRNLLPSGADPFTEEQQNFKKEISELLITSGRELQDIREKCLDTEKMPEPSKMKIKRDGDEDGIP